VNAAYGYNAISRVRLTQTAPTGFAEGQAQFAARAKVAPAPRTEASAPRRRLLQAGADEDLRKPLKPLARPFYIQTRHLTKEIR
jgi:hypothetical protein